MFEKKTVSNERTIYSKNVPFLTLKRVCIFLAIVCVVGLTLFFLQQPSNNRDWQDTVAIMPKVSVSGDVVTIKQVRDWRYEKDGPVSKEYLTRTFNLSQLDQLWFLIEPFSGWDGVAHTFFTFDFKNQPPISFSIESRREKDEDFSPFQGLFRKYELIYLWGSEQDFTVGRVINQHNKIYMFPLKSTTEFNKQLFLELAKQTQYLHDHPKFYNTLTDNCTSSLADRANAVRKGSIPFHYARFLPGFSGPLLYKLGYLDNSIPYEQLKEKYLINPYVEKYYLDPNFSEILRKKLK